MNTYSVIMLGPSGSGKTVFLASMYKKLSTQGDIGFFLEVDGVEKGNRLHDLYTQVAFEEKWPKGTAYSEISEWSFTCRVQTANLPIYSACQFTYLDYAGGRLTDDIERGDREFHNKLKNADVLLGLLDGQRIMALMQHQKLGSIWAINELPKMLSLMQRSEKPIHFVISKWDIVQDQYSLTDIINLLTEIEEFKNLVQSRNKAGIPIRIIPVSAVGKGFATLQPDGSMTKNLKVLPKPFQVEVPLACVLPDLIQSEYKELEKQKVELKTADIEVKPNLSFFEQVGQLVGGGLKTAQGFVPNLVDLFLPKKYEFAKDIIQHMMMAAGEIAEAPAHKKQEIAKRRAEELRQDREEALKAVADEQTALKYALDCFLSIANELYCKFPESNL